MKWNRYFKQVLEKTKILKSPDHRLSTFGESRIQYFFISEIAEFKDRSRLRRGLVLAEKPKVLTRDLLKNKFEGFGDDTENFGKWLQEVYGDQFRGLEYKFRNESNYSQVEHSSLPQLTDEIQKRLEENEAKRSVILQGPDSGWQISLMKYIVDECLASFQVNLRELHEHGFFDSPQDILRNRKKTIEDLFVQAKKDSHYIGVLGNKLNEYGLFKEYEDDFFKLVQSI